MKNQYRDINLKSSSWITDASGSVNQHLQYLPFGEQFIDQRSANGQDIRFKFTGKERDAETGMDYFGARYYDSDISVWLSVDPLADKYSGISPYAYVFNNPVMFVDKWGLEGEPVKMKVRKVHSDRDGQEKFRFKNKKTGAKGYIYTPKGKKAKDVKNDFTNGTMNNYDVYTYNNGDLTNEQHYDNNGDLMGDVQFGGNLSGVDITYKLTPAEKMKAKGYNHLTGHEIIYLVTKDENIWVPTGISLAALKTNMYVGAAITLTAINMHLRKAEYKAGFNEAVRYYLNNNEEDGIFWKSESRQMGLHICTEIVRFYSAKSGKLIGTSRIHHAD